MYSKTFDTYSFTGIWKDVIGLPSTVGLWIIYGAEKHGKTTFALLLAEYLSQFVRVLYVSAEEGTEKEFVDATRRAQLNPNNRNLQFTEYMSLEDLTVRLNKRKAPKVVFLDNCTIYQDELKSGGLARFREANADKLLVFVAHEERKEPYTSSAKRIRKLAKVIVRIVGLTAFVGGRCPGGTVTINEQKAELYHGTGE